MIVFFIILAALLAFEAVALMYLVLNDQTPNYVKAICAVLSVLTLFCTIRFAILAHEYKHKPSRKIVVVTTCEKPQIDTLITIKNGVSDTTYVYHIRKKK